MRLARTRTMGILQILLALIAFVVIGLFIVVLTNVENWRRDFTTNFAETDESSSDVRLRPIHSPAPPPELAARAMAAARKLPGWELADQNPAGQTIELHFVRKTPVLRFKDDIRVHIEPTSEGGSRLTAYSRSRVGKGDLGQNPRNLRELLEAVRTNTQSQ